MNCISKKSSSGILRHLVSLLPSIAIFLCCILQAGAFDFAHVSKGKQPVTFGSFINLYHIDATRSSFQEQFRKEAAETRTITFKVDQSECSLYPAPEGYDYLKVADLKPNARPDAPQLPVKTFVVELGKNAQVYGVEVIDGLAREIEGEINVIPAPRPLAFEPGAEGGRRVPDAGIYALDKPFPGKLVSYETGADNERQYVFVRLFPVQYTPSRKKAILLTEATINLYYTPSSAEPITETESSAHCIVICPDALIGAANHLCTLYGFRGFTSEVALTSDIDDLQPAEDPPFSGYKDKRLRGRRNIKNYDYTLALQIMTYLRGKMDPNVDTYVTILGDGEQISPSYYYSESGGNSSSWIPTDLLYASPDYNTDQLLVPNFKVGRLSVSDLSEAWHVVSKIENWSADWEGWFHKAYLVGGRAHDTPEYHGERGTVYALNEGFFSGMHITKCFHTDGSETKSCVEPAFRDGGVGIVYNIGHGSGTSIALTYPDKITVGDLAGYTIPVTNVPVVISVSCGNGAFDTDLVGDGTDSFGEAVLKSEAGGIAYMGGSRHNTGAGEIYYDQGNLVIEKEDYNVALLHYALQSYYQRPGQQVGAETLGEMAFDSINTYITYNYNPDDPEDKGALFRFVLLGDPALKLPVRPLLPPEHAKALCTAVKPFPSGYDGANIPFYTAPPVCVTADGTTSSPTVEWKLIDAGADITHYEEYDITSPSHEYQYNPQDYSYSIYLLKTATESAVYVCPEYPEDNYTLENWFYFSIEEPSGGIIHVHDMQMSWETRGQSKYAVATVTIYDDNDPISPVPRATVYGHWVEEESTYSDSGFTDRNGQVSLTSNKVGNASNIKFGFCVDNVEHKDYLYDSDSNAVTCDEITVP